PVRVGGLDSAGRHQRHVVPRHGPVAVGDVDHRGVGHRDGGGGGPAVAVGIGDLVGEVGLALEAGGGDELHRIVAVDGGRAIVVGCDREGQRAIGSRVVAQDVDVVQGGVHRRDQAAVIDRGQVVDRGDGDGDGGRRAVVGAVVGDEGEAVAAVVVGGRRVGVGAGAGVGDGHGAVGGAAVFAVEGEGDRGALDRVAARQGARPGGVLGGGQDVGVGHRKVVDRVHRQGDRGGVGVEVPVVGLEREAVRPVVVGGGRVGVGAVGVEHQAAVGRSAHHGVGQAVAVDVAGGHAGVEHRLLVDRRRGGVGHRGVVDRGDGDGDGGRRAVVGAVVGDEAEAVAAVVVGLRRVGVGAGGGVGDGHGAVGGAAVFAVEGEGDRGALDRVAARQGARPGGVLGGGQDVGVGHRNVVDRDHRHGHSGRGAVSITVSHGIGEAVGAVVVGGRR